MYELNKLSLKAGKKVLIEHLSVSFARSEITAVLGANGAGKSSLFRAILGETQSRDHILFCDQALSDHALQDLAKHRAYIAQHKQVHLQLPVLDYLLLARELYVETEQQALTKIAQVSEKVGIVDRLGECISTLSGGEFQLVEFARAYLQLADDVDDMTTKCLLLDEPASALDLRQRQKLYHLIKGFNAAGGTVLIIDHDINAMAKLADNLLMLKGGKVLCHGKTAQVFTTATLNSTFDINGNVLQDTEGGLFYLPEQMSGKIPN